MKFSLLLFFDFAFLHFTPRPSQERGFGGVNHFCVERGAESPYWINRFDNTAKDRQEPAKSGHSALGYKTPKEFAEANSVLGSCGKQKPFPTTPQVD